MKNRPRSLLRCYEFSLFQRLLLVSVIVAMFRLNSVDEGSCAYRADETVLMYRYGKGEIAMVGGNRKREVRGGSHRSATCSATPVICLHTARRSDFDASV